VSGIDAWRARHARYKEDVAKRGKPFFPHAMFHDTVMSLVVVAVIVGLACVWYYTSGEEAGEEGAGWLGPRYTDKADPGTTSFVPRPDWYFYFLFYLLRIFKWPESVVLGTVGIPTILLIIMFLLPFLDRRMERRLSRRPVAVTTAVVTVIAMGTLTYKGATVEEAFGLGATLANTFVEENDLPEEARAGAELFVEAGCMNCHTYLGEGSSNFGAPDLTEIGRDRDEAYFERYVADPSQFGNNTMPKYAALGEEALQDLAVFLAASDGAGGG
jgi:hypothetical protein